jgi:hypothetical protein
LYRGIIGYCSYDEGCDYCDEKPRWPRDATGYAPGSPTPQEEVASMSSQEVVEMAKEVEDLPEVPKLLMKCMAHPDGNCPTIHQIVPAFDLAAEKKA